MKKYFFVFLFGLIIFINNSGAYAVQAWTPSEQEQKLLPRYCQDKFGAKKDRSKAIKWSRKFGGAWQHLHHYCAGLNFINRANRSWDDKENKKFNLNRARTNFEYMVNHTDKSFVLLTDVYYRLGEVYKMRNNFSEASKQYSKSIELNPKYVKPYRGLSDIYIKSGQFDKAIEILEAGLKKKPKSKSLKRKLSEAKKKLKEKSNNKVKSSIEEPKKQVDSKEKKEEKQD